MSTEKTLIEIDLDGSPFKVINKYANSLDFSFKDQKWYLNSIGTPSFLTSMFKHFLTTDKFLGEDGKEGEELKEWIRLKVSSDDLLHPNKTIRDMAAEVIKDKECNNT